MRSDTRVVMLRGIDIGISETNIERRRTFIAAVDSIVAASGPV